jgi:hypothetical protein
MTTQPQFRPAKILEAVALFPNSLKKASAVAGCSSATMQKYLKRMDAEAGGCVIARNFRGKRAVTVQTQWTAANRAKLAAIFQRVPCPSNEAIGEEIGTTASAIMTAKNRFGLGKRKLVANPKAPHVREYVQVNPKRVIACLNCRKPFGSHGFGNRLCTQCYGVGSLNQQQEDNYGL